MAAPDFNKTNVVCVKPELKAPGDKITINLSRAPFDDCAQNVMLVAL